MGQLLETATIGAREAVLAQAVNTNNLANVSTTGFRRDLIMYMGTANELGAGRATIDTSQGPLQTTNRNLDIAINGEGWIAVAATGGEAYTRRGDLRVDSVGQLTNAVGQLILGNTGPISLPPYSDIQIGSDGTISIRGLGEAPNSLSVVDRIRLVKVNPGLLTKGEDGLIRQASNEPAQADSSVQIISGTLEGSNVNPVESLVRMIDLSRKFETQVKMMQTAKDNQRLLNEILRFS